MRLGRRSRIALFTLAASLLVAGGGLTLASRSPAVRAWVLARLEIRLSAALGRPVQVAAVAIRPWPGRLELTGVRVPGRPEGARFAADRVELAWSWSDLLRRRLVLRSLSLSRPRLILAGAGPSAARLEESLPLFLQAQPVALAGWPLTVRRASVQQGQVQWVEGETIRGSLDGLQGEWTWRGVRPEERRVRGELRIARWRMALAGRAQELTDLRARLEGSGSTLTLAEAEGHLAGARVQASGPLLDGAGRPRLNLQLRIQAPLQALLAALGSARRLAGSLAIAGSLDGPPAAIVFQGEGSLTLPGEAGAPAPVPFRLRWADGLLSAETAGLPATPGDADQAHLAFRPATGAYTARLRTVKADLRHLSGLPATLGALLGLRLPPGLGGRLTADVDLRGQGGDLTTLRGHAAIHADALLVPGETAPGRLWAQLTATSERLSLQALGLALPGAQVEGRGDWNFRTGELNLPLRAELRDVSAFGGSLGLPALGGQATFQGRLRGTREAPALQGRLRWRDARIAGARLDGVEGDIQLAGRTLRTSRLTLRNGRTLATLRGSLRARGTAPLRALDLRRDLILDLAGQTSSARTADLAALLPPELEVEGSFRASGRLTGPPAALSGRVEVALGSVRTWEESWQRGSATLRMRQGAVEVTRLLLRRGPEQLGGAIRLGADGSLQGELLSTPLDLARCGLLAGSDLAGRARVRLTLQGSLRETRTLGQAEVSALIFQGTPFGPGSASFSLERKAVSLDLTLGQGAERLQAVFGPPPGRTVRATLTLREAELAPILGLAAIQVAPAWQPRASGQIVLQAPAKALAAGEGTFRLDRLRLRLGETPWQSRGPVQGSFARRALTLQPVRLSSGSAEVELRGTAGEGTATDLAATGTLPLVLLAPWLPVAHPAAGTAEVALRLRGAWGAPALQGSIRIHDGRLGLFGMPLEFQGVQATLAFREGGIQIEDWTARLAGGSFAGSGAVRQRDGAWEFEVSLEEAGGRAEQLLAPLTGRTGEVTGKVFLGGALSSHGVTGPEQMRHLTGSLKLRMEDGRIGRYTFLSRLLSLLNVTELLRLTSPELTGAAMPYRTLTADFVVQQGIARTENLLLDSRAMQVNAVGRIDLPAGTADLTVAIKPFQTVDSILTTIPLAGWILGGKEQSLLVAYYEVHGPLTSPRVTPVPLRSVGRNLFGIFRNLLGIPAALSAAFEDLPAQPSKPEEGSAR